MPFPIVGLPSELCGHNKTQEDPAQVFTTNSNQLTVIFKRSDYGRRFSGNFSIKYVEFHSGMFICGHFMLFLSIYRCKRVVSI